MKLYNSLTKKIENFKPLNNRQVRIYSCGPTVYDHAHIGNLSSYIYADTLRRVLEVKGYDVKHVMNYTDVDDKTIKRSLDKFPDTEPVDALKKLTNEYIDLFHKDIKQVGIDIDKIEFVRATDSIEEMKNIIFDLVQNNIAYITDDGVYFSIEKYIKTSKKYGQLLEIAESNTSNARIDNDEYDKDSIHDFALWKKQKIGEPAWDFEIAGQNMKGRPGWHIECSAMSKKALDIPFDIHTGGIDLIFPHHENEIAQSTALGDNKLMAKFFVHNNHLLVDGKKMSKSEKNFYTLQDIVDKGYDPIAFRLLVLQSHYRKESNFTWDSLESAQNRLQKIREVFDLRFQIKSSSRTPDSIYEYNNAYIDNSISEDLDTPKLLKIVSKIVNDTLEKNLAEIEKESDSFINSLKLIDKIVGLGEFKKQDISDQQKKIIKDREQARDKKNWEESDKLRDELKHQGLGVRDTNDGSVWYRL